MKALQAAAGSLFLIALPVASVQAQVPGGQDACKPEKISPQKQLDFATAFSAAEKRAKAWQADVVVASATNTSGGPIDAEGRSSHWYMIFWSPGAKQSDLMHIVDGSITCWAQPGPSGRLPQLNPDFYRDVKTILAEAAKKGGAELMAAGYLPTVALSSVVGGRGMWFVNYEHPQKGDALQVTFDANTGKFNKAIKSR